MKFKLLMIIVLCALESSWGQNPTGQQHTNSIPLNPCVRYGKLDNDFTYYIQKNEEPKNTVELRLVVKAGRIHEDEDQLEYAHLLEHLLAGKTEHFPNIKDHITKAGGYSNAHTGSRLTLYEARLPSQDKQVVKDGIQLLRDWAQGIKWDEDYLAKQRGAVEGEMRVPDPYRDWVSKTTEREVLKNTGYKIYENNQRLENLKNFNPEAFTQFYKDWYRPDLQAAFIVGDINVDSMEYIIKRRFSDLKPPDNPKSGQERLDSHKIHLDGSNRYSTVLDSSRQKLILSITRLRPNFESHPKTRVDYKNMLLQQIYKLIVQEKSGHLEQQYDLPFTNFVTSYGINQIPDRQIDASQMKIDLKTDSLDLMKKKFQKGLIAWKQMHTDIELKDLERAKTAVIEKYDDDNLMSSSFLIRRYVDHFLYGKAAPSPEIDTKIVLEMLSEIELKDIRQFILEYGNLDKNSVFIFFKGTKLIIPDHKVFKEWAKETYTMQITPLKKEQTIESLTNVITSPPNISKKEILITENEIGISTIDLPNGIKVLFKPTKPRKHSFSNLVEIQAFRPNNVPVQNRQEYLAASVAPQVIQYTGAGQYNKFQLEQFKKNRGIRLNFWSTKDNQRVYASSKVADLAELLNLLYLYFDQPQKDKVAFDAWKANQTKILEGEEVRGSTEFIMDKITHLWYPQIPVLDMGVLSEITLDQVFQASKQRFSSFENFTFIVTGDFNKDTVIPYVVNALTSFPVATKKPGPSKPSFDFPLKKMKEKLEFKNIDQVYVRLFYPVKVSRTIKTQIELQLISMALNEVINSTLRIGSYSPRASGEWLDIKNGIFAFRIDFDSALGKEDEMVVYAREVFHKLKENGVGKKWLDTAITNELRYYENRFGSFGHFNFWPDYLQLKLEADEDSVQGILNYGTLLEHFIGLEDINYAIKNYMSEEHFQQFLGYPEGKDNQVNKF